MTFAHPGDSHKHSLETLHQLVEYDEFMESITSVVDLGCGNGDDLLWWATRTTRDTVPVPLNISCTGIDVNVQPLLSITNHNINYQQHDFENFIEHSDKGFDILWCHDAFQFAVSPVQTLTRWRDIASNGAMLYICVPLTQQIYHRHLNYYLPSGNYYHYSLVNLIYMLATAGWDCRSGFFKQSPTDNWLHAIVYKSNQEPLNPKTTSWHELSELKLLPESADTSIYAHGYLRQQDLIIPWIDRGLTSMARQ
jgi:ubiquinone/menaquinone biosynthesis C-methylase UbiE